MSTAIPTPERSTLAKPQRILACVLCQQRKVKCDRKFPCANCIGSHAQCVPAVTRPPHQRRRRFPERELLDRLRRYESLLYQNNIRFEPLHKDDKTTENESRRANSASGGADDFPDDEHPDAIAGVDQPSSPLTTVKSESVNKTKNFWDAMNQKSQDSDDESSSSSADIMHETVVKKAWDQVCQTDDHLLFGSHKAAVNLSTLHPEQVQIFKLWQVYLDNVNPLLKVTHTPTFQGRIIDAAVNLASIKPSFAALMFSIYCMSVQSLTDEECCDTFGSSKEQLLTRYQSGCQQALWNSGFLRSTDRECLTALYLYLVSIRTNTDPYSLSSMLSVAIRTAQRMGLHSESTNIKCSPFEAEMRRRLWWSLILFDTRVCEMADYKAVMLTPTWDCRSPLNVNDFDLQPEMKDPPAVQGTSTEALFTVVRGEMGEFVRNSAFHLDFINPTLKPFAKDIPRGSFSEHDELVILEKSINDKYLRFCNPGNPLHFMTIWMTRGFLAKNRLLEHYSRFSAVPTQQTDAQRDAAVSHALNMLECDTKLMNSPLTKGFSWFIHVYFPFPAYVHISQDLRRRPVSDHAERAWKVMSCNYEARFTFLGQADFPFFKIFAKVILPTWEAREAVPSKSRTSLIPPQIVTKIRQQMAQLTQAQQVTKTEQQSDVLGTSVDDISMSMPIDFSGQGMFFDVGGQGYDGLGTGPYLNVPGKNTLDTGVDQLDWNAMDWNLIQQRSWWG